MTTDYANFYTDLFKLICPCGQCQSKDSPRHVLHHILDHLGHYHDASYTIRSIVPHEFCAIPCPPYDLTIPDHILSIQVHAYDEYIHGFDAMPNYVLRALSDAVHGLLHVAHDVITRHISQMITTFKNEICQLSALHKLQLYIKNFFLPNQVGVIFDKLEAENQFELISGLWHQTQNIFNPLLMEIIQQGNHEQTMHVIYLNETIPFFWSIVNCLLFSAHSKEDPQILTKKLFIATSSLERILGIKEGLLELPIIQQ